MRTWLTNLITSAVDQSLAKWRWLAVMKAMVSRAGGEIAVLAEADLAVDAVECVSVIRERGMECRDVVRRDRHRPARRWK
jgi:hypothetical protein